MTNSPDSQRSPTQLWAVLGEHPTQRHNDFLAERLHVLAGLPDRRPHRLRRLVLHLEAIWFRPPARVRRREAATRAARARRLQAEHGAPGEPAQGILL